MIDDALIEAMARVVLEAASNGDCDRDAISTYCAPMREALALAAPVIRSMTLAEAEFVTVRLADRYAALAAGAASDAHRDQLFHRSNALREAATNIRSLHQPNRS